MAKKPDKSFGGKEAAKELLEEYKNYTKNPLYKSVMNIIVRANKKEFQEVKEMCEALEELMYEELEEKRRLGLQEGEKRVNALTLRLYELGKNRRIIKAALDKEYQKKLFEEFGL